MKSEHLFIIRLGDGRHFEYEGTLDGAKRKASKLATPPRQESVGPRSSPRRRWPFNCLRSSGLLPHEGRISVGTAKWGGTLGSFSRGLFEQGRAPEQRAPVSY